MKIYAIRHGETDINAEGRILGYKSDPSLNEVGIKQAHEVAKTLKDRGIDFIVTSPMNRAMETADIIAEHLGISKNKMMRALRLYERDFGDYEGKLFSEVDMDSLRRWTDNAPTPNGETIQELSSRVFGWIDDNLAKCKETIEHEEYRKLDSEEDKRRITKVGGYKERSSDEIYEQVTRLMDKAKENCKSKAILFVVHGHVLRTMHWYFNGIPDADEVTLPKSENCEIFEFNTAKIPQKMSNYQIIIDRKILEDRLKRLVKSPYKATYTTCFAMCYMIGDSEISYVDYTCPACKKKTKHSSDCARELESAMNAVEEITKSRLKIDAVIDPREYCKHCFGEVNYPSPVLKIRFSPNEEYHEARTGNYYDYSCLTAFIKGMSEYQGRSEGSFDVHHPLVDCIDQIVMMTGLCPEVVEEWKTKIEKIEAQNAKGTLTKEKTLNMKGDVIIPHGYTEIGKEAFDGRGAITSVIIPNSVTSIGEGAFKWCEFSNITIPDSVIYIGKGAFGLSGLIDITFPPKVTSIADEMFEFCHDLKNVAIHEGITSIGKDVFIHCDSLTTIDVSENNLFFSSVDGILFDKEKKTLICYPAGIEQDSYTIPDGVTTIGEGAFEYCKHLKSVTIPPSVTTIKKSAFSSCDSLKTINFSDTALSIGEYAFSHCDSLININLPNTLKKISYSMFWGCENLESVNIPESIVSIGYHAFHECEKLKSITFHDNITDIDSKAFEGTEWLEAQPDGVIYIGNIVHTYKGDKTKLKSLALREGTRTISSSAFEKCENLADVTFPDSIIDIGAYAFHDTAWLRSQPDGIVYIKHIAHTYKGDRKLNTFTSLELREDTKKISAYAFCFCDWMKSVTIPDGVTRIGRGAFWRCEKLTDVVIPDSVIYIGEDAFGGCDKLQESAQVRIKEIINNSSTGGANE